jgi:hypothetical protein
MGYKRITSDMDPYKSRPWGTYDTKGLNFLTPNIETAKGWAMGLASEHSLYTQYLLGKFNEKLYAATPAVIEFVLPYDFSFSLSGGEFFKKEYIKNLNILSNALIAREDILLSAIEKHKESPQESLGKIGDVLRNVYGLSGIMLYYAEYGKDRLIDAVLLPLLNKDFNAIDQNFVYFLLRELSTPEIIPASYVRFIYRVLPASALVLFWENPHVEISTDSQILYHGTTLDRAISIATSPIEMYAASTEEAALDDAQYHINNLVQILTDISINLGKRIPLVYRRTLELRKKKFEKILTFWEERERTLLQQQATKINTPQLNFDL